MNELGRIADDVKQTDAFIKFWGDRYIESRAALETIRDLLIARLHTAKVEISRVKAKQRELKAELAAPTEGEET